MKQSILPNFLISLFTTILFSYIIYFGFTTNYTRQVFSVPSFTKQYDSGIYKYRILGKKIILLINELLEGVGVHSEQSMRLKPLDYQATNTFYLSYFVLNTIGLFLFSWILLNLLQDHFIFNINSNEIYQLLLIAALLICITQYVITPYDNFSYFLQIFCTYFILKHIFYGRLLYLILAGIILVFASLCRESAAICVAFAALLYLYKDGFSKKAIYPISFLFLCFFIPYLSLRFIYGFDNALVHGITLLSNLTAHNNLIGCATWIVLGAYSLCFSIHKTNRQLILLFHLISLPYIFTCLLSGIFFEVRLYIPLFIGSLVLSKINTEYLKLSTYKYSNA